MPRQSVLLWLMELPNSTNREQRGKKRKRYPLAERYPSAMNHLPARTPSPSKRRKRQDTDVHGNDTENTPRPFNLTVLLSLRDDASQHSTSSTRSSATSPRSRSPTKQMSEILFAPQPILFKLEELIKEASEIADERGEGSQGLEVSLPFLPIIIVLGHDWNFLAAIREPGKQTCIYHKINFGSTSSPLGVYQVVTTIQLLACWVRDSFTGWFEKFCLGMREDNEDIDVIDDSLDNVSMER